MIDQNAVPRLCDWFPGNDCIFTNDGPQSRGITKHLNDLGTKVFNWPGRCVDLNLIEELWKYLKGRTSGVELI